MIYLYLKTHNVTGKKYLGKTAQDPHTYKGSGVYWKNHIRKHGNDVTTEVLRICKSNDEVKEWGLYYSELFSVVESNDFANLMEENGIGGVPTNAFPKGHIPWCKGKKVPSISIARKEYWIKWREENPGYKDKWKRRGRVSTERLAVVSNIYANKMTDQNRVELVCPHCGKVGKGHANMKRWHFSRCKNKG